MNFKKFISGVSSLAIAASAFAAMTITASATVYTEQVVDLSSFGTYDAETNTSSFSINDSTWQKLDIKSYTQKANETTTKVTVSYTNTVSSGTRSVIGFYDDDLATYPASWGSGGGAAVYGEMDSSSGQRTYFGGTQKDRKGGIFPMNESFNVSLTFDLVSSTVSGTIGNTTYTDVSIGSVDSIDTFAVQRWNSTLNYSIKDLKITTETSSAAKVTRTIESKCGDLVLASAEVTNLPGEDYSYSPSAYLQDTQGTYYKYSGITEAGAVPEVTGQIPDTADTISINYTKADNVVAFAEVSASNNDGTHGVYAGVADNSNASAGKDGGVIFGSSTSTGNRCIQTFTVPAYGKYRVTVNTVGTSSGARTCDVTVDSIDAADALATLSSNGSPAVESFDVDLTSGSHSLYYIGGAAIGPKLDYMVVELVKEYTVVNATNEGAFKSDEDETEVATAFTAETNMVSGTVDITITPSSAEIGEAKTFTSQTVLTNANVILGIIVNGLYDDAATAVVTIR